MDSTASVARDIIGGIPLLSCPPYNQTTPPVGWRSMGMFNPTITITFAIHAFISLLFAFLIYWRYNSVSLFGRRIYNNYISNTYWFAYFISIALEAILEATRYWLNLPYRQIPSTNPSIPSRDGPSISDSNVDSDTMDSATYFKLVDAAMLICTTVLHSFTLLFLACALRWQISHRGKFIKESFFQKPRTNNSHLGAGNGARNYYQNEDDIEESQSYRDELVPNENADFDGLNDYSPSLSEAFPFLNRAGMTKDQKKKWWKSLFLEEKDKGYQFSFTKFFVVLFVLSNVALYLDVTPIGIPNLFFYVYIFSLCTLYVPIIYMTFYICFWMKTSASPSSAQTLFRQASENHSDFDDDETHLNETNSIERAADQGSSSSVNQLRNSVEHLIQMDELIRTNRNSKKRRKDGPTCYSKFILFIAMLTSFITVFPFNIWNRLLDDLNTGNLSSINSSYGTPSISNSSFLPIVPNFDLPIKTDIPQTIIYRLTHCIPLSSHEHKRPNSTISSFNSDEQPIEPESSFFSFLDILHIVGVFSSLAFFEFVRSEFARVKQRSTFYMVRIVRETFGFF